MATKKSEEIDDLKEQVRELESKLSDAKNQPFFAFDTWQNSIKTVAMPIALLSAVFAFWDSIVLGFVGQDRESIENVRENIETLQAMDQEQFVLHQEGKIGEASANEAAVVAKRDRLVAETFEHWERNPSYFRPAELQILMHQLIMQNRTDDALEIFGDYWKTRELPAQKAEAKVMEARILSGEGPVLNVEKSIQSLEEAFAFSEEISNRASRDLMQAQILYKRGLVEIDQVGDCEAGASFVSLLEESAAQLQDPGSQTSAEELRRVYDRACSQ